MNIAAENIRGIRNGLTSFSIDEELAITKGSEHYDCPENWVEIVDDALEKITERNSILKNEPPNNFSDGGLDDSDEGEDGGDEGGLDKSSTQSSLPDDDEGKGGRDEEGDGKDEDNEENEDEEDEVGKRAGKRRLGN